MRDEPIDPHARIVVIGAGSDPATDLKSLLQ